MVGNTDLLLDDVDPADLFRDRMFDLDARIHFHEVVAAIGSHQKLDGARRRITDMLTCPGRPNVSGVEVGSARARIVAARS